MSIKTNAENAVAEADAERAAVVRYLLNRSPLLLLVRDSAQLREWLKEIERGEHRKEARE